MVTCAKNDGYARKIRLFGANCGGVAGPRVGLMPPRSRNQNGMTLIEIVFSIGILTLALAVIIGFVMGMIARNRQISMEVAGLHALNHVMGQVEDFADSSASGEAIAHAIVREIRDLEGDSIAIGPNNTLLRRVEEDHGNGRLIYRFWVPAPGGNRYPEGDPRFTPNHRAVGEMHLYLDEVRLNSQYLPQFAWQDLNSLPTNPVNMDLDLNGVHTDNFMSNYDDIKQLAISISVTFFADDAHTRQLFTTTRNILEARVKDATEDFDPTLPKG